MNYQVADRVVACDVALPELSRTGANAHWRFVTCAAAAPRAGKPFHFWRTPRGSRSATFARVGDSLLTHFARTVSFVTDFESRTVWCHPSRRSRPESVRTALINQMIPLLLGDERLVLHASAVATPAGAVVFVAPPGHGKSTLASALALSGMPLITDDVLVIDQRDRRLVALPSGVAPRLWPDSVSALFAGRLATFRRIGPGSTKRRISQGLPLATHPLPVAHVFLLDRSTQLAVEKISAADAVAAVTASTFVGRIDERMVVRTAFERVTALVAQVPTQRLALEHDLAGLERACDLIRDAVR